jgi:pimeloyl-ACP methyl ester carboxylesterase
MKCRRLAPLLLLLSGLAAAAPPDEAAIVLPIGGGEVSARFLPERQGPSRGGVVLLPDVGTGMELGVAAASLFRALPDHGWSMLAVPLPPVAADTAAWLDGARPRIAAAIAHLREQGILNVALVGQGFGALAAADYAADGGDRTLHGLVVVGIPGLADPRLDAAAMLARSPVPVLDLFGSRGRADVVATAERRAVTARAMLAKAAAEKGAARLESAALPDYRQVVVEGATYDFSTQQETLVRRVRGWLQRHMDGTRVAVEPKENR